jgi:serine/threonine-protein kinase
VPGVAVDGLAQRRATADQATVRNESAPTVRGGGPPRRPAVPDAAAPGEPRRSIAGPLLLALLLIAIVGGGLLYASLVGRGGTVETGGPPTSVPAPTIAQALPTEPPVVTAPPGEPSATATLAAPTEQPPAPTTPASSPTVAPPAPATATPTVEPSATPTVEPSVTATSEPSATPAVEPSATPETAACPEPLTGGFGMLWEQEKQVRQRLGCPTEAEQGGQGTIAEQPFERGSMFYYNLLERIYVLDGRNRGRWRLFEQSELRDLPTPTPAPDPSCPAPLVGGFGLVWGSFEDVRKAVGCSTAPEDGLIEGAYQPFQNGTMLFSQKGLGRGKTIYVLYDDRSFERYDDPNQ